MDYWKRIWNVPEIKLSQHKVAWYGSHRQSLGALRQIVSPHVNTLPFNLFGDLFWYKLLHNGRQLLLAQAIARCSVAEASLLEDRIYALAGLSRDVYRFPVDYENGDRLQLYLQTMSFCLDEIMRTAERSHLSASDVLDLSGKVATALELQAPDGEDLIYRTYDFSSYRRVSLQH